MLIVSWITWWYTEGWANQSRRMVTRIKQLYLDFSVPLLLVTLFAPWRRIVTGKDGSLGQRLRATLDNAVSRLVGLMVRLLTLIAALLMILATAIFGFATALAWPLLPVAGIVLVIKGITG